MRKKLELSSRDIFTINDFVELHNDNMEFINDMFNKFIVASNRQNSEIFWLKLSTITLAGTIYLLANRLERAEQQIKGLQDMAKVNMEADKTEEK